MARPALDLESIGKMTRTTLHGKPAASAYYRDSAGKRKRMVKTGATHKQAEIALERAIKDVIGLTSDGEQITRETTIAALSEEWLEMKRAEEMKPGSMRVYKSSLTTHILPTIGDMRLYEATVPRMDRFVSTLKKNSGAATAVTSRVVLSGMFALAVRYGALKANPIDGTAPVSQKRKKPVSPGKDAVIGIRSRFLESDQLNPRSKVKLFDACEMFTGTGMRTGELLALKWEDVDLVTATIKIHRTIAVDEGGKFFVQDQTKSDDGERTLHLPPQVVKMLRRREPLRAFSEFVFPSTAGTFWHPNNFRTAWRKALAGTDYEGITPRSFRKLVATTLQRALGSRAAGDQLGHTSEKTTETYYIAPTRTGPETDALADLFALKVATK